MIAFISSVFGDSINAKPLDSCVSGLRITLIASATRFSAASQPLISSAVTQAGKLPRKTVKLIQRLSSTPPVGDCFEEVFHESTSMLTQPWARVNRQMLNSRSCAFIRGQSLFQPVLTPAQIGGIGVLPRRTRQLQRPRRVFLAMLVMLGQLFERLHAKRIAGRRQ